jgi:hypothetical protein
MTYSSVLNSDQKSPIRFNAGEAIPQYEYSSKTGTYRIAHPTENVTLTDLDASEELVAVSAIPKDLYYDG